jgi:hypothetical protein
MKDRRTKLKEHGKYEKEAKKTNNKEIKIKGKKE